MQQHYTSPSKNGTADNTLNLDNSKMEGYAASSEQEKSLSFIEECEEVAADMARGINQTRRATIFVRKEQSELIKDRAYLCEMIETCQRDFETAVRHTKTLISKEQDQK